MKTTTIQMRNTKCEMQGVIAQDGPLLSFRTPRSAPRTQGAFTLIELLVVISIMALLAAFIFPVLGALHKKAAISTATAELGQIVNALQNYHSKYGVYPPSNALPPDTYASPATNTMFSPLYYELSGVTNNGTDFVTLDGSTHIKVADVQTAFGVGGFINCAKSGDEAAAAQNFLLGLRANRVGSCISAGSVQISNLITSVRGPDATYSPVGVTDVNPFRYVCPGVNNPDTYDLYVQLKISGKLYLVCNWSTTPIIGSPLP